jgi:hypothetical protein
MAATVLSIFMLSIRFLEIFAAADQRPGEKL